MWTRAFALGSKSDNPARHVRPMSNFLAFYHAMSDTNFAYASTTIACRESSEFCRFSEFSVPWPVTAAFILSSYKCTARCCQHWWQQLSWWLAADSWKRVLGSRMRTRAFALGFFFFFFFFGCMHLSRWYPALVDGCSPTRDPNV